MSRLACPSLDWAGETFGAATRSAKSHSAGRFRLGRASPVASVQRVTQSYLMLLLASDSVYPSRSDCITCRTFWVSSKKQRQQRIGSDRQRWEIMLKRNAIQANETLKSGCVVEHLWRE